MGKEYGFFVKVFSKEEYRNDFLKGKIFMNTIKFFKEFEDAHDGNVGDKHEAVGGWFQPKGMRIVIKPEGAEPIIITEEDLGGPVIVRMNRHDAINVFCITLLHSHGVGIDEQVDEETFEKLKSYFTVPDDLANLGEYAVVIPKIPPFLDKIRNAAGALITDKQALSFRAEKVNYYDKNSSLTLTNPDDAVFYKQSDYEHQSEFRFCLDRGRDVAEPFILEVGDLDGIALPCLTNEINSFIKFEKY
ncbi:hypothetical protein [Enterobacter asburiae]|uniref:hypothetical protein n=1 Tax=Enterobacter asburiae TaxID=61645 RepID=UPI0006469F44|nr:hypothetical protein [Enterobacter asburiae]